ncbi:unnamed protein product [Ceutorhynchus assimilis]|uniref:CHK kinase-like domain-containing protein n=1 Tax=Ceutorhynchus assimilis TaxID=467358 RepID=A0A9P0DM01_9CUCU|nr:unnamed protein product [Ceutorhynchus assimilis]
MPSQVFSIKGIEKVINKSHDGQVKNVEVTRLTAPGENYLSMVLGVKFDIEKNGHSKTHNAVAKRFPAGSKHLNMSIATTKNEIRWYAEILPSLTAFAKEYGYKFENFFAPYYGSRYSLDPLKKEPDNEAVLLVENLTTEGGYKMADRYIGFDLETTKEILKTLAIFHGIPIAMKIRKPDQFKILKSLLELSLMKPPKGSDGKPKHFGPPPGVKKPEEMLLDAIADLPDCAPYVMKLEKLLLKERDMGFSMPPGPEPWNTIVHGDLWLNNMMVRDKKDPRVKLVDFQVYSYGSYARDLVFFLLTSVRNDVTREHLDDLLRYYYEEFTAVLKYTETNLNLTYEEFLQEVETVARKSESMHALTFSPIVFAAKNTGVDTTLNEEFDFMNAMTRMIQNMTQSHKDKLVVMASEIVRRNWL